MRDPVVLQQLRDKGVVLDDMMRQRYEAIERSPRILDKPPGKLKIARVKEPAEYGIAAQFKDLYNQSYGTIDSDIFYIDICGVKRIILDERVYYTLKALLIQNLSLSEQLSCACSNLFKGIAMHAGESTEMVTEQNMYSVLQSWKPETYAEKVLIQAINETCFSTSSTVLAWREIAASDGYYLYAIRRGEQYIVENQLSDKDLKEFIRSNYRAAKANKDFMKRLVKDVPTKAVIAMIYYMREDEKMFEESTDNLGFM